VRCGWRGITLKTILVAIDGSKAAEKALEVAFDLARQHHAQVRLLHVLLRDKEPEELLRLPDLTSANHDLATELRRLAQEQPVERSAAELMADPSAPSRPVPESLLRWIGDHLLRRASNLAHRRRVPAEALELADGPVATAITEAAEALQVEVIVMGSRGLRLIDALGFGSASQEVCRSTHRTCITVH
jgi:nucleotide-binding universal stress UspA family protein